MGYLVKEKTMMKAENTFAGLDYDNTDDINKAVAAAIKYGEIFVGG